MDYIVPVVSVAKLSFKKNSLLSALINSLAIPRKMTQS